MLQRFGQLRCRSHRMRRCRILGKLPTSSWMPFAKSLLETESFLFCEWGEREEGEDVALLLEDDDGR